MINKEQAKVELKKKGWTYRKAAPVLKLKSFVSVCRILSGEYQNRRVLNAIEALPTYEEYIKSQTAG